jgi:transposase
MSTNEAIGRSRGGPTTKIHLMADSQCRPLGFALSEGQASDLVHLEAILDSVHVKRAGRGRPRKRPDLLILDKAYSFVPCRRLLRRRGIRSCILEREDHRERRLLKGQAGGRPPGCAQATYEQRNVVERCILRLQWFRRIAVRFDKRAENYRAFVTLATIILWLR